MCLSDDLKRLKRAIRKAEGFVEASDRQAASERNADRIRTDSALDRVLPEGGLRRGTLVEWLAQESATGGLAMGGLATRSGAGTLAIVLARAASRGEKTIVVMDRARRFYAPAAIPFGIAPTQWMILRPQTDSDEAWAVDQAARSPSVAALLWWPSHQVGSLVFRRWQLACETSGCIGIVVRPESARNEPSWAQVRLHVRPGRPRRPDGRSASRYVHVQRLRCRQGTAGTSVPLEIDDETGEIREATALHLVPPRAASQQHRSA